MLVNAARATSLHRLQLSLERQWKIADGDTAKLFPAA